MIIKDFVPRNPNKIAGFLMLFLILNSFLFPLSSIGQTAEAEKNFTTICKACHTIGGGRLVGPDLKGITEKMDEAWLIKFIRNSQEMVQSGDPDAVKVWEEHNKIPMPPNPQFSDDQIRDILLYIKNGGKIAGEAETSEATPAESQPEQKVAETITGNEEQELLVEKKQKEARNLQATFIVMVVLIVLSLFDLFITKLVRWRWIHIVIILISIAIGSEVLFVEATSLGRQKYYQPDQPIWFSHKVHAGQNRIDCKYCHFTADKSMHAGIPPVHVCLNCHNQVKAGKRTGTKEIAKIFDAFKNNKPIEWVKVHNLPDHVYFNHAQHVTVGKVDCIDCHGDVAKMDVIIQTKDLSMGWCIDCHRTREVQFATNKFYDQYKRLHEEIASGKKDKVTVVDIGGEDCQKCHY